MKVTLVPEHIVVVPVAIITLADKSGLTVISISFDVAGESVKHGLAFEIMITVTKSASFNEVDVKLEAVSPKTSVPLICH